MNTRSQDIRVRFEDRIGSREECWVWTGSMLKSGYGRMRFNGPSRRAHRISYELYRSRIPEGLNVLHTCDNPTCVNPEHLFLGTDVDNNKDRDTKGRTAHQKGEASGASKLTEQDIRAIKQDTRRHLVVAREYGVVPSLIGMIRRGLRWSHVDGPVWPTIPPRGEACHCAKLTEQDIRSIRADTRVQRVIATAYGVTPSLISMIRNRRIWKHVEGG